jgi:hypothetical protein
MNQYRFITVEQRGDAACVRLKKTRIDETEIYEMGGELVDLCESGGCRKLALSLGPQPPDCLYSVFLAKLITIRNTLRKHGGQFVLCELSPVAYSVFEACLLHREFTFAPDFDAAVMLMSPPVVK